MQPFPQYTEGRKHDSMRRFQKKKMKKRLDSRERKKGRMMKRERIEGRGGKNACLRGKEHLTRGRRGEKGVYVANVCKGGGKCARFELQKGGKVEKKKRRAIFKKEITPNNRFERGTGGSGIWKKGKEKKRFRVVHGKARKPRPGGGVKEALREKKSFHLADRKNKGAGKGGEKKKTLPDGLKRKKEKALG